MGLRSMSFPTAEVTFNRGAGLFCCDLADDHDRSHVGPKHPSIILTDVAKRERRHAAGRGVAKGRIVFRQECRIQGMLCPISWALQFAGYTFSKLAPHDFE